LFNGKNSKIFNTFCIEYVVLTGRIFFQNLLINYWYCTPYWTIQNYNYSNFLKTYLLNYYFFFERERERNVNTFKYEKNMSKNNLIKSINLYNMPTS